MDNISTTTPYYQHATEIYQSGKFLHAERAVTEVLYVVIGIAAILFNGSMIYFYRRYHRVRKHVSFMLLQLFVFCLCHGLVTGTLRVTHRVFLLDLPIPWCIISNLTIELFDHYTLVLIAMLAIERYVYVTRPFFSKNSMRLWGRVAVAVSVVTVGLVSCLPLMPFLGLPRTPYIVSRDPAVAEKEALYHHAVNCHDNLNRENIASPIITFALGVVSVSTLLTVYIRLYFVVKSRLSLFSAMTHRRRRKLRQAARCVMWVAAVFMISILPYGVTLELQTMCSVLGWKHSVCFLISSTLLDWFSVLATMSSFLAPGCFVALNPYIRKEIRRATSCDWPGRADQSSTTNTKAPGDTPSPSRRDYGSEVTRESGVRY